MWTYIRQQRESRFYSLKTQKLKKLKKIFRGICHNNICHQNASSIEKKKQILSFVTQNVHVLSNLFSETRLKVWKIYLGFKLVF